MEDGGRILGAVEGTGTDMNGVGAARADRADRAARLFDRIGNFLDAHRLDCEPSNFAFAHTVLSQPDSALAKAVQALADGGVRLTRKDIEALGGDVAVSPAEAQRKADVLVARTQMQIESFDDTIHAIRAETQDFGRELAATADAIERSREPGGAGRDAVNDVARLTHAMIERVRTTEAQLERATEETAALRGQLEEARENARRDPLTDLPNRRAFEEAFAAQVETGAMLCVAVCDVDHFKSVNDRFGHVVGDRVLRTIGGALSEACPGHLVARYGGEEFVILFSGIELDAASAILDNARSVVSNKHYKLRETDEPLGQISFSGGVTNVADGEGCGTVFHRADRMLYSAKNAGRNRIVTG